MKDYGVYLLLRLDKQEAVKIFVDTFKERVRTDLNLAKIWKDAFCDIVFEEKEKYRVLIRLEPYFRFTRHAIPLILSKAAKTGLDKAGYTGQIESSKDKQIIKKYAIQYIPQLMENEPRKNN